MLLTVSASESCDDQRQDVSMLARRPQRLGLQISERRVLLLVGDIFGLGLGLAAALWLRDDAILGAFRNLGRIYEIRLHWWPVLWTVWVLLATALNCYDFDSRRARCKARYTLAALRLWSQPRTFFVPYVSGPLVFSRSSGVISAVVSSVGVAVWRTAYASLIRQPLFCRRLLVIGAGRSGRALVSAIDCLPESSGMQLVGLLDDELALQQARAGSVSVLGDSSDLLPTVEREQVSEIAIAISDPSSMSRPLTQGLVVCRSAAISLIPMTAYYEQVAEALSVEILGQNLLAILGQNSMAAQHLWDLSRRAADVGCALAGMLGLLVLLPWIALAIYADCPGPTFYSQLRVGKSGSAFRIFKFRSMIPNAESNGTVWASENDPRVTRFGRIMRRTRIDELPQLWNLLVGNMTLISPRPERPEFVRELQTILRYYAIRHTIKPGLTGWAQARYRYGSTVEDALVKLEYDLYYVKHRGPVLDLMIALKTLRVVLEPRGT